MSLAVHEINVPSYNLGVCRNWGIYLEEEREFLVLTDCKRRKSLYSSKNTKSTKPADAINCFQIHEGIAGDEPRRHFGQRH